MADSPSNIGIKTTQYVPNYTPTVKKDEYGTGQGQAGSIAAGTDPTESRNWYYNEFLPFYQGVMNGTETPPPNWGDIVASAQATHDFLGLTDAMPTTSGWNIAQSGLGAPTGTQGLPPDDLFGGQPGQFNNYTYTNEEARLAFMGSEIPSDIWSNDLNLDVPAVSAHTTVQETSDTRFDPPEDVIKITVDDPATGAESVYYVHDYEDAAISINTPGGKNVDFIPPELANKTNVDGNNLLAVNDLQSSLKTEVNPQSSVEGTPVDGEDNAYRYEAATVSDTIDFTPQPGVDANDNEVHYVTGNTTITVPLSSSVAVGPNMVDPSDPTSGYNYVAVVTHDNGSTDTFYLKGGTFDHHINALPENTTFITGANPDGTAITETGTVPSAYQDDFTIYGAEGAAATGAPPDMTPPSETGTDPIWQIPMNTYEDPTGVTLYNVATTNTSHNIFTPGTVNINAQSFQDQIQIDRNATTGAIVVAITHDAGQPTAVSELYYINPINGTLPTINLSGNNVTYGPGLAGPFGSDDAGQLQGLAALASLGQINVNGANAAQAVAAAAAPAEAPPPEIPSNLQGLMDTLGLSGEEGLQEVASAFTSASGTEWTVDNVIAAFNSLGDPAYDGGITNTFFTAMGYLDQDLQSAYQDYIAENAKGADATEGELRDSIDTVVDRIVELLTIAKGQVPAGSIFATSDFGEFQYNGTVYKITPPFLTDGSTNDSFSAYKTS